MNTEKDPALWKAAQERATFKYHVLIYFIFNLLFWVMWYIGLKEGAINGPESLDESFDIPWPVWPMAFWGIGLLFHYIGVYRTNTRWAEKEYKKLENRKKKQNY